MSQLKADDIVDSAGTGKPKFSKGLDLSQATGFNKYPVGTKSADYTITTTDGLETILVTAAANVAITLPAASSSGGRRILIKKVDSGTGYVSVVRAGADTIDGATTRYIPAQYNFIELQSDGTSSWTIINDYRRIFARVICNNASQTISKATLTTVTGLSITSDILGMWTTTSRIVIKEEGYYRISAQVRTEMSYSTPPTLTDFNSYIHINNSVTCQFNAAFKPNDTLSSIAPTVNSITRYCAVNDYIEILAYISYTGGTGHSLYVGVNGNNTSLEAMRL